jgi:hypothetical protein
MTVASGRHIALQAERLRRHHSAAVNNSDEVTLLDLANTLRVWTDMRDQLRDTIRPLYDGPFTSALPASEVESLANGVPHAIAYLEPHVSTRLPVERRVSEGSPVDGDFTLGFDMRVAPDGQTTDIRSFQWIGRSLAASEMKPLACRPVVSAVNYARWLNSEAVRVALVGATEPIRLSRDTVIRRTANILGGSHPDGAASAHPADPSVRWMMMFKVSGIPLPYFILLHCSTEILRVAGTQTV